MRIECPNCSFSREVNRDKVPEGTELATCPKCGHKFLFRDLQGGPADDFEFTEAEPAPETPRADSGPEAKIPAPFEDLENFGFFPGMAQTIKRAILSPGLFFRTMELRGIARPVAFGVLMIEFGLIMSLLWQVAGLPPLSDFLPKNLVELFGAGRMPMDPFWIFFIMPLQAAASIFLESGLLHGLLLALRSGKAGYEGTLRTVAYANAVLLVAVIPYGMILAMPASLAIQIVGMRHIHDTTWAKSAFVNILFMAAGLALLYTIAQNMPAMPA